MRNGTVFVICVIAGMLALVGLMENAAAYDYKPVCFFCTWKDRTMLDVYYSWPSFEKALENPDECELLFTREELENVLKSSIEAWNTEGGHDLTFVFKGPGTQTTPFSRRVMVTAIVLTMKIGR